MKEKKRCIACKAMVDVTKFGTYKKKDGTFNIKGTCKRCEYARNSKKEFKNPKAIQRFVENIMFDVTGRDY